MSAHRSEGFTVWFTGLPCSGKTTLAGMLARSLAQILGREVELLDGDVVRTHLSEGLGFSRKDRDTNIRRIAWVCQLLTRHGVPNIAAAISPYRQAREEARQMVERVGGKGRFVEIYTRCPVETCESRDHKGLYRKARAGELENFTGISDPYQPPPSPEVLLDTDRETPDVSLERILDALRSLKLIY